MAFVESTQRSNRDVSPIDCEEESQVQQAQACPTLNDNSRASSDCGHPVLHIPSSGSGTVSIDPTSKASDSSCTLKVAMPHEENLHQAIPDYIERDKDESIEANHGAAYDASPHSTEGSCPAHSGYFGLHGLRRKHTDGKVWQTTFLRGGPLVGIGALMFVLLSIPAAAIVLYLSNGQAVETWKVQPNVYLSVFTGVGNKVLAFAAAEGAIVTWWVRAIRRTTLRNLHCDWAASTNMASALFSKHFSILTATSLCAMVILVDGILLQSATTTVQQSLNMPIKLHAVLPPEVPTNFTGLAAKLDARNDFLQTTIKEGFAPVWKDWVTQVPVSSIIEGCPGVCEATVKAPALFSTGCEVTETAFINFTTLAATNGSESSYPAICEWQDDDTGHWCPILSITISTSAEADPREQVLVSIGMIGSEVGKTNAGNYTKRVCTLEPAIAEYQVVVHGGSQVEVKSENPSILSLANNTAHAETAPFEYINSTLGGIAVLADMSYHSQVLAKVRTDATWLNSPGPFQQSLIEDPDFFYRMDNHNPPILRDPWDEILAGLNELMFRAAALAGRELDGETTAELIDPGLPVRYDLDGIRVDAQPVFHTRWGYFWGASAIQVVCVALVTITYWKYWTLGRNTSLSPLELAKAFDTPLLKDVSPNLSARRLAEELGDRKVRYGLVFAGEDEESGGRLVFDDGGRVRPLRDGCSTL